MTLKTFVASQSLLWIVIALLLLFVPRQFIGYFGPQLDAGATVVARIFAAELTALAIVSYFETARHWPSAPSMAWIAYTASNTLGFLATLEGTRSGALNQHGWILVGVYLLYAAWFAAVLVRKPQERPS
jgi:hypothetical protein